MASPSQLSSFFYNNKTQSTALYDCFLPLKANHLPQYHQSVSLYERPSPAHMQHKVSNVCMCPPLNFPNNRPIVAKRIWPLVAARAPEFLICRNQEKAAAVALTGNSAALRATARAVGTELYRTAVRFAASRQADYSSCNATDVLPDGG